MASDWGHNTVKKEQCSIKIYRHYFGCCKDNVFIGRSKETKWKWDLVGGYTVALVIRDNVYNFTQYYKFLANFCSKFSLKYLNPKYVVSMWKKMDYKHIITTS